MFIAFLTLCSALSISCIAAFYSIVGLAAIFPGAFYPVVLMGAALEGAKLVCASWLYRNWEVTNRALRTYLFCAVIILSLITSMGIFGFLSKAHLENDYQSSSNGQQIEIIDSQIKHERDMIALQQDTIKRNAGEGGGSGEQIALLKNKLKQMDAEVKAYTDQGSKGIFNDNVAKGVSLKEQQKPERDKIEAEIKKLSSANSGSNTEAQAAITRSQQRIQDLIAKKAPLQQTQIKLDADVGPIKYIGALAVDLGLASKVDTGAATRWIIILIIFVFDPLAVLMLIAANQSFAGKFPRLKPTPVIDPEKPDDLDIVPVAPTNNAKEGIKEKLENQLRDWQYKLSVFNRKVKEIEPIKETTTEESVSYNIQDAIENTPNTIENTSPQADSEKKTPEEIITQDISNIDIVAPTTESVKTEDTKKSFLGLIKTVLVNKKKPINVDNIIEKNDAIDQTALPTISNQELKENFGIETGGYQQNEEQNESNGWSQIVKIKDTTLPHDEYRKRISDRINILADRVRSGEIQLSDLAEEDQKSVNDILNPNA
jgi:hypothetical protein